MRLADLRARILDRFAAWEQHSSHPSDHDALAEAMWEEATWQRSAHHHPSTPISEMRWMQSGEIRKASPGERTLPDDIRWY